MKTENTHLKRTIEKNKMFVKSKVDPVRVETEKRNKQKIEEEKRKVEERKMMYQNELQNQI